MKTKSEQLFEELCNERGWTCTPIERTQSRTPDYDLSMGGERIVVEIKQIDANSDDKRAKEAFDKGMAGVLNCPPGQRVRQKITDGGKQLRVRTKGTYPSTLVIFNNVFLSDYTDAYHVRVGMYGFETLQIRVPRSYDESPSVMDRKFGSNRRMTAEHNTSISAVAVLRTDLEDKPYMCVYHNVFAEIPLNNELLKDKRVIQFTLAAKIGKEFREWWEI